MLYDLGNRKKLPFKSLKNKHVRMYCCGPTVYGLLHIGNFRGAVVYNLLNNWLKFLGYTVDYIYNFTDVDDKILARAQDEGVTPKELSEKYIKEFKTDYQALKLSPHTSNPKATDHIKEMQELVKKLIQSGRAYEVDGDVFFSVKSFPSYGYLSGKKIQDLIKGYRVEPHPKKQDSLDFSLWKKSKKQEWGWDSPWGKGRPGWHLECTAMIHKYLGPQIDIHGGGCDLIFPHHENERAQSESAEAGPYVSYWVHNEMILINQDKMSKSKGNIITMREFLQSNSAEVFKFLIHSSHYRSTVMFSEATLAQSIRSLGRIYSSLVKADACLKASKSQIKHPDFETYLQDKEDQIQQAFNDDLSTPKVLSYLFELISRFNQLLQVTKVSLEQKAWCANELKRIFIKYGKLLALFQESPHEFLTSIDNQILKKQGISRDQVNEKVKARFEARQKRNFKLSDKIREELLEWGIEVRDTSTGAEWEVLK